MEVVTRVCSSSLILTIGEDFLFPRATGRAATPARIFGGCREGQIPRSSAAEQDFKEKERLYYGKEKVLYDDGDCLHVRKAAYWQHL
ncbi:MAG: hypothetical protein HFH00_07910 [Dorea sp.]|nr:hypothetical protein [Dorea sp.]